MRNSIIILVLLVLSFITFKSLDLQPEDMIESEISKKNWLEPNDWFYNQRAYPDGKVNIDQYRKAQQKALDMRGQLSKSPLEYKPVIVPNISGRVVDIEMLEDQQTVFVGTASGGVFRSKDQGATWNPISDEIPSLSIADIEITSNPELIYVATGEPNAGGGSLAYDGTGVYKSIDGGDSWTSTSLDYTGSIGKIVSDPDDPQKVVAGLMGRLFENNAERGIYLTEDGGDSWTQTLYIDDSTGVIDVIMDPLNSKILYCATWTRVRRPAFRDYGGTGSGIYKSIDGGMSWELLTSYANNQDDLGRIGLAMSENLEENKLYAISSFGSGPMKGFSVSSDGGQTWSEKSIDDIVSVPFMWWFGSLEVDPKNENKVFYPGFELQYTENGGDSWNDIESSMHVDQHVAFVHPDNTDLVFAGNDGGVYKSLDGGVFWEKMNGLQNLQFYTCEVNPNDINEVYGGAQDNSTIRSTISGSGNWEQILGGDGFVVQVDPEDENVIYAEWQRGRFYKSINNGVNMSFSMTGIPNSALFNWKTPYVLDPQNSSTLYIGAERVYKSTNKADNWVAISNDLSGDPFNGNINYGTITSLDVSGVNDQFLIAGTDNGKVHITQNGGSTWTDVSGELPDYWVTSVQADPDVDGTAYVSFSGYRYAQDEGYIYRTIDYGATWEDIGANLPAIPVNELMKIPEQDLMFAATDVGLFTSPTDFVDWEFSSTNLPSVVCTDLDYHRDNNVITVATYGRGIYQADLDFYSSNNESSKIVDFQLYPNPAIDIIQLKTDMKFDALEVMDINGQVILSKKGHDQSLNIENLVSGSYFLILKSDNQLVARSEFIKML